MTPPVALLDILPRAQNDPVEAQDLQQPAAEPTAAMLAPAAQGQLLASDQTGTSCC
jgi:hypothetical protein